MLLPKCILKNGVTLSIQASSVHHCDPQVDDASAYTNVEVGFPSERIDALMPYIQWPDEDNPTGAVYAHVPAEVLLNVVEAAGGLQEGLLPGLLVDGRTHIHWARRSD